jgi:hypothetical protein
MARGAILPGLSFAAAGAVVLAAGVFGVVHAQPAQAPPAVLALPTLHVEAAPPAAATGTIGKAPCVVAEGAGRLDCVNQALADTAARAQAAATPHTDAPTIGSSPTTLGEANVAATRERLGSSFGKSVVPQRPAQTFAPPLGRPPL